MITKEDFAAIVDAEPLDSRVAAIKLGFMVEKLLAERDEALKWKEAYRSMLKGHLLKSREGSAEEYEKIAGPTYGLNRYLVWETDWESIDAEAKCIVEGK